MARKHKGRRGGKAQPAAPAQDAAPMPGPHEFNAGDEAAMRGGVRQARGASPTNQGGIFEPPGEPIE